MIPLGNVISGNDRNGIEVSGTASGFTSFNTFAGTLRLRGGRPEQARWDPDHLHAAATT